MSKDDALLTAARKSFHQAILGKVLSVSGDDIPSNADTGNSASIHIARGIASRLLAETREKTAGQTSGNVFEAITMQFIRDTFPKLQDLRPGNWTVMKLGNKGKIKTSDFCQYEHLAYLSELARKSKILSTMIGTDYMVSPDIVVYRDLYTDDEINAKTRIVDFDVSGLADLRKNDSNKPILHASISAKWTMRSDRAQNSRTEALNLIRNRKGHLPHIVVVTGEPLPSRIASIALGTGDIDCVYHFALYELIDSVKEYGLKFDREDIVDDLDTLVKGKRLKDISDLPLDLCV